jgi:zinc/manganese transport system substrate-binding protein
VTLMADAAEALGDELAALDGIDAEAVRAATDDYVAELGRLDAEVNSIVATIPDDRRTLVTNHEVFGYFAARWGFEVVGTVIPAGTTQADPSSAEVEALAEVVEEAGVPAIFAETSSPTTLADALAETVGDVEVVELFSESLGEEGSGGETYVDMMRTNAERIAEALA